MNQNSTLLCPFGIGDVQFMPHILEDISEFDRVGSIRFDEGLMGFEHGPLLGCVVV